MDLNSRTRPVIRTETLPTDVREAIKERFPRAIDAYYTLEIDEYVGRNTFYEIMRGEPAASNYVNLVAKSWEFYSEPIFKVGYLRDSLQKAINHVSELTGRKVSAEEFITEVNKLREKGEL